VPRVCSRWGRPPNPRHRRSILLASLLAVAACRDKPSEPEPEASRGTPAPSSSPRPARRPSSSPSPSGPNEVTYDAPHGWTVGKTRPMIKAAYVVPKADGDAEDGELTVSQVGGTVDQNLQRWAQQLDKKPGDAKRSERTVNGLAVTIVEIHGTFGGMAMPGAPPPVKKPGFGLLGAIVQTSPPTFFKLTGPDKTVAAARRDFDALVASVRAR
jgi:hypothetical protein